MLSESWIIERMIIRAIRVGEWNAIEEMIDGVLFPEYYRPRYSQKAMEIRFRHIVHKYW